MKTVIKGRHFTEIITTRKGSPKETVHHWKLSRPRKLSECGTWVDGKKVEETG